MKLDLTQRARDVIQALWSGNPAAQDLAKQAFFHVMEDFPAGLADEVCSALIRDLGRVTTVPAGRVYYGHAVWLWGNPLRDPNYGWRCGNCTETGHLYTTLERAQKAAEQHASGQHAATEPVVTEVQQPIPAERRSSGPAAAATSSGSPRPAGRCSARPRHRTAGRSSM